MVTTIVSARYDYMHTVLAEFFDVIGTKVLFTVISVNGFPFPSPMSISGLKLVCNVNIVNRISSLRTLKTDNPTKLYVHEFGFWID